MKTELHVQQLFAVILSLSLPLDLYRTLHFSAALGMLSNMLAVFAKALTPNIGSLVTFLILLNDLEKASLMSEISPVIL